jgi:DNA-binding transcriptional LysR family regulator
MIVLARPLCTIAQHGSQKGGAVLDWNNLHFFLAVARCGSTLAAGKMLRVNHTTVARRVEALEAALKVTLFERRPTGYVLPPAGEALVAPAETMDVAAAQAVELAARQSREASGTVRLTVAEVLAVTLVAPILREFYKVHSGIRIELDTAEAHRDLAAGEADVALRLTLKPAGGGLVGRRIGMSSWTIYGSRDYAAAHGLPREPKELTQHVLISGGAPLPSKLYDAWMKRHGLIETVAMHQDTTTGLLAAVKAGVGLAALPSIVADIDPDLVMCFPGLPKYNIDLWLLTHERLRHTPRVRVVLDFLAERLTRLAREGQARQAKATAENAPAK